MGHKIRLFSLIMILMILNAFIIGCYDQREVDDMAYAVAVGLDKGKNNFLKLTLQFAAPLTLAGGGGGGGESGGGGKKEKTNMITVETPSLYAGLNMINVSLSKQVNLSHAKIVIFSEDLAKEGVNKFVYGLIRGKEFRPNINIAVARNSAEEVISNIKPILDPHPAKYYELLFKGSNYTGFFSSNQLQDFYSDIQSPSRQAVASLFEKDKFEDSGKFNNDDSTYIKKGHPYPLEGDYKAGDVPKTGDVKAQVIGLAVFRADKMVGELDGEEAGYYLMMNGEFHYSYWSIPDPRDKDYIVVINLKQSRKPVIKVNITGSRPEISVNVKLEADFISIQSGQNYEADNEFFEASTEAFLKEGMLRFLHKTAKEYKSDICGFGKQVQGKFLFWNQWEKFGWLNQYKDADFKVNVDLRMRRPGLIVRTVKQNNE